MSEFDPGPLAEVSTEDGSTLVFVRDLRQGPELVWAALTEPGQLSGWAPFDPDRPLDTVGEVVLTMVDGETRTPLRADVLTVRRPELLEYTWGGDLLRWELAPVGTGTRLTLRHTVRDPDLLTRVAAGWHLCLVVAQQLLDGDRRGPIRGQDALRYGYAELQSAYARRLEIDETVL